MKKGLFKGVLTVLLGVLLMFFATSCIGDGQGSQASSNYANVTEGVSEENKNSTSDEHTQEAPAGETTNAPSNGSNWTQNY